MSYSIWNKSICDKISRLGLSVPEELDYSILDMPRYDLTEEEEYKIYRDQFMISKDDILKRIASERELIKEGKLKEEGLAEPLDRLYGELYEQISDSNLFDAPEGYWHYTIERDSMGVRLKLVEENGYVNEDLDYILEEYGDEYIMFDIPAKLLTIEQYAQLYNVQAVTVRQWIRRGKIRTAVKRGKEWRIPELSKIPNKERGYTTAVYSWDAPLDDAPEGFDYINKYSRVAISQFTQDMNIPGAVKIDLKKFSLEFYNSGSGEKGMTVVSDILEKEKFELYLISNPGVKYVNEIASVIE